MRMASLGEKVADRFHETVVVASRVRLHCLGGN